MRYLIAALVTLMVLACIPNAAAQEWPAKKDWYKGDIVATAVICKDEETILQVVNADMKSEEAVILTMNKLIRAEVCAGFPQPIMFLVDKALLHYKDHKDRPSVVLGVVNGDRKFLGWILVAGIFKKGEKPTGGQKIAI